MTSKKKGPKPTCSFPDYDYWYQFEQADLTQSYLEKAYKLCIYWGDQKRVLKHKDCPRQIRDDFANSKIWYQRIVALLSKGATKDDWFIAAQDLDVRVRRSAICNIKMREMVDEYAILSKNGRYYDLDVARIKQDLEEAKTSIGLISPTKWVREKAKKELDV